MWGGIKLFHGKANRHSLVSICVAKGAAHLNQGTAEVLEQGTKRLSHFVGVSTVLQMLLSRCGAAFFCGLGSVTRVQFVVVCHDTVNVKLDISEKC